MYCPFMLLIFILCTFQVIYINSIQFLFYGSEYCIKWVLKEVGVNPATYLINTAIQLILIKFCICTVLPKHFLITFHFGLYESYSVLYTEVSLACGICNSSVVEIKFSLLVWYVTPCCLMDRSNYAALPEEPSAPV